MHAFSYPLYIGNVNKQKSYNSFGWILSKQYLLVDKQRIDSTWPLSEEVALFCVLV